MASFVVVAAAVVPQAHRLKAIVARTKVIFLQTLFDSLLNVDVFSAGENITRRIFTFFFSYCKPTKGRSSVVQTQNSILELR